jgi:mRNA interferase MazF
MVRWSWEPGRPGMVIRKGSISWVNFSPGKGSGPIGRRPGLVIQNDILNDSKLNTVIMLAITSTIKFGELPGNVILRKGEANLPKKCVINTTQIKSVDKKNIKEKIGMLSNKRMDEVHEGLKLVLTIPLK